MREHPIENYKRQQMRKKELLLSFQSRERGTAESHNEATYKNNIMFKWNVWHFVMTRYSITHGVRLHFKKLCSKPHPEVMHFTISCSHIASPCVQWQRTVQHCSSCPQSSLQSDLIARHAHSEPGWPSVRHLSHCLQLCVVYCYLKISVWWGGEKDGAGRSEEEKVKE